MGFLLLHTTIIDLLCMALQYKEIRVPTLKILIIQKPPTQRLFRIIF